jgi:hypothetical protein
MFLQLIQIFRNYWEFKNINLWSFLNIKIQLWIKFNILYHFLTYIPTKFKQIL